MMGHAPPERAAWALLVVVASIFIGGLSATAAGIYAGWITLAGALICEVALFLVTLAGLGIVTTMERGTDDQDQRQHAPAARTTGQDADDALDAEWWDDTEPIHTRKAA
jgi:fatty acid desaturase